MPNDQPKGPGKMAPNPGYDRPHREPTARRAPPTEVYPKPFITKLRGQPTINRNAQRQMRDALREQ